MKKLAVIFSLVFIAAIAGLAGVVAATGTDFNYDGNFYIGFDIGGELMKNGETKTTDITDAFEDIALSVISAEINFKVTDTAAPKVTYTSHSDCDCEVYVKDKVLVINEKKNVFTLFSFGFLFGKNELTVELPKAQYGNVSINSVSGGGNFSGLTAESLTFNTTSGDFNISAFAKTLAISSVSGNMQMSNPLTDECDSFSLRTTSGRYSISGFKTKQFEVKTISGDVEISGISGKGSLNMTSGDVDISFAEWNDDISVSTISGDVDIILPAGSGADVSFSGISGDVTSLLDGSNVKIGKGSTSTVGGSNKHNIGINLTSGDVTIRN